MCNDHKPDNLLKIAALPLDIAWGDPRENLYQASRAFDTLPAGTDIVVLPELFTTGFTCDRSLIASLAEGPGGPTLARAAEWAHDHSCAVSGTYMASDAEDNYYNRCFFVEPSGDVTIYDKHHLFSLSGEAEAFTAGKQLPPVVRFRGWNVQMVVCYDLRFPAWCRARGADGYDVLLVPANWAVARQYAWHHLLIARAIENQAIVVGANRSGDDDYGTYTGTTAIYDAMGMPIGQQESTSPWVVATASRNQLQQTRRRMPSSLDRDAISIEV